MTYSTDDAINKIKWTKRERRKKDRTDKKYKKLVKRELIKAEKRKRKMKLKELRNKYKPVKKKKKKKSTTKLLVFFIILNCSIVEIYSMFIMYNLKDLSALYSLIGAVVGESIAFAIYCAKSFKETKEEAINKLERDKFNASMGQPIEEEDIEEDDESYELEEDDLEDISEEDEEDTLYV